MLPSSYNNASSMLRSDYGPLERIGAPDSSVYRGQGNDGGFIALRFVRTDDLTVRDALGRVAHTASAIRHPMLAAVGGCQRFAGDASCVVSEYVPGQPLDRWVRENGLPPLRMTVDFVRRLCLGLHVAHQRELTHSALQPGNLMVLQPDTRPGGRIVAKLLDVGVPSWLRVWPPRLAAAHFIAPELLRVNARPAAPEITGDASTDVYACGALLHFLCTGVPPFQCVSLSQLLAAAGAARPFQRPCYVNSEIPPELEAVILRALAIDPTERIDSMAEFALSLSDVEAQCSESGVRRRDPHARRRRPTSHDAITPVVHLRALRSSHGSQSSPALGATSVALPRGVAPANAAPAAVIPRAQLAPSGTYPRVEWTPKRSHSGGLALVAVSTLLASYAAYLAWFSHGSHGENLKPAMPAAIAKREAPAPRAVQPSPFEAPRPTDPSAAAALATGSHARARATTFAPDRESRVARDKRAAARRARALEVEVEVETSTPAAEAQLPAAPRTPTDGREPLAEAAPELDPATRAAAAPASFAESAPAEPTPAQVTLQPSRDGSNNDSAAASARRTPRGVRVEAIHVRGSLSPSVVRRALDRIRPLLYRCVQQHAGTDAATVQVSTTIDEIGRARDATAHGSVSPALNECLAAAAGRLIADSPDTGTVRVSWTVEY